jgi:biotin operon repressor
MNLVFENHELSTTEKMIMLALADHANDEGKSIYPSQGTVARKTSLARETVNRHVQFLIEKGYLVDKGYRQDRSNVLEVAINVSKLKEEGVIENPIGVTENHRGCDGESQGGVTENHTNQKHLNIIESPLILNDEPDLFDQCCRIYETKKGSLVTDGRGFALMIKKFVEHGVTAEDYAAAIDAMDADPNYTGHKPTSYEKWAIGYARQRASPSAPKTDRTQQKSNREIIKEMIDNGEL